jgi:predicted dehydrogenase
MADPLRVGVIGANPDRGWAATAHLPALSGLSDIELVAVATTRRESADDAAARFGARRAFDDPYALIDQDDVEAVTVSVKVPGHFPLVQAALEAGKHVYCEWPLCATTEQAIILRDLAERQRLHTIIGLQGRRGPAVRRARDLVADGYVGTVLSATLIGSHPFLGGTHTSTSMAWMADQANGANLLTISTGHALDSLATIVGEFAEVSGTVTTRVRESTVTETGETIPVTSPDQVAVNGFLADGSVIVAHMRSGTPGGHAFSLKVNGTEGLLEVVAATGLASSQIMLRGTRAGADPVELDVPGSYRLVPAEVPDGPPLHVAHLYRDLYRAVRHGEQDGPDFNVAVSRHQLLDTIQRASATGRRQAAGGS